MPLRPLPEPSSPSAVETKPAGFSREMILTLQPHPAKLKHEKTMRMRKLGVHAPAPAPAAGATSAPAVAAPLATSVPRGVDEAPAGPGQCAASVATPAGVDTRGHIPA